MNHPANTPLVLAALMLLVASAVALAACDTAIQEEPPAAPAPVARTALAANFLNALAANMTPFDAFRFKGNSHFTQAQKTG